ncbi:MAG: hypothetical protein LBI78_07755 [Campylobacteraceae bacterium]|jgi:hypothetical protein|nr:hypothetical protein [Campylobacteraceae bacterium]
MKQLLIILVFIGCCIQAEVINNNNATKQEAWHDNKNRYLSIEGDVNGDNMSDKIQMDISNDGKKLVLVALINEGNNSFKQYILTDDLESNYKEIMGIRLLKAGTYETACSKGYFDCSLEGNLSITIDFNSIEFFKYEGASSIFYWNNENSNFSRIWISD